MPAAPVLKRYVKNTLVVGNVNPLVTAVPAGRALVVSKVSVTGVAAISKFGLLLNNTAWIVYDMPLARGEQWTESGLVLVAGDTINIGIDVVDGVQVTLFGQEVDN